MVKKIVSLVCVAVLLISMVCFVACSGAGEDISGTYELTEMVTNGQDMSSTLSQLTVTLTVEGNKATLEMYGQSVEWKVDTAAQTMTSEDGASAPYKIEGDKLIIENNAEGSVNKMVFEKVESTSDSQ